MASSIGPEAIHLNGSAAPDAEARNEGGRGGKKKLNPLVDLIETEKSYVELLASIIRRVAAAWSRTNFPPPELDGVFRSVEAIYKANRSLHNRLKEIGPNPSSPKALGDLLMQWVDDLEAPYTRYCDGYATGFDEWAPIRSNLNLPVILDELSSTLPTSEFPNVSGTTWTLDALFSVPAQRIKYYKKLYSRLLKSTQPGRSDHKLLMGANERLSKLMETIEQRSVVIVGGGERPPKEILPPLSIHTEPTQSPRSLTSPPPRGSSRGPSPSPGGSVAPLNIGGPSGSRGPSPRNGSTSPLPGPGQGPSAASASGPGPGFPSQPPIDGMRTSNGSTGESSSSGRRSQTTDERDSRHSGATSNTSVGRGSTSTMTAPITDLERRLSTERVLDIFTMAPRKCRLQMTPPNLPFTRRVRLSSDVKINFTPKSTGTEVVHRRAHIFLLTDLFLICDRMTDEERKDGFDMWLCYPPLSAKHLVASEIPGQDNLFEIRVMKKEVLIIHTDSRATKESMLLHFREARDDAAQVQPSGARTLPPGGDSLDPRDFPQRARTASPPDMQPPRPQFGRLHTGSDPNLPGLMAGPPRQGSLGPDPGSGYKPPPRGASRNPNGAQAPEIRFEPTSPLHLTDPSRQASDPHSLQNLPPLPASPLPPFNGNQQSAHSYQNQPNGHPRFQQGPNPNMPPPSRNGQGPPRPGQDLNNSWGPNAPSVRSMDTFPSQPRQLSTASSSSRGGGFGSSVSSMSRQNTIDENSPPSSPDGERLPKGPLTNSITATMKCKVFLKQHHAQWKALGNGKLLLYTQQPTNVKQLVVEADNKSKSLMISTIVLTDAVQRVGKAGVAIELSDKGQLTGIIYMIMLKSESSATGLFQTLLAGSDRLPQGTT